MSEGSVFSRVGERLTDLLSDDGVKPAAPAGRPATVLAHEEFERRASHIVRDTGRTLAGAVNFIGLDKIKEKLGDRWDKVAERADEAARRAIERRLESADIYTRHGNLQYVVLFAHLSKEHARLKCAMIAEEIMKRLLGDEIAPDLLEVKTIISQAEHDETVGSAPNLAMLTARLAAEEAATRPAEQECDDWWNPAGKSDPLDSVQLAYRPLWDVRHNALATYICTPTVLDASARLLLGNDDIAGSADAETANRLDLMMQRRVIGDLRRLLTLGRKLLLCLPVHFETLASNSRRARYLERCSSGVPSGGERFLAFELVGAPAGMPQGRLLELASSLKRHARYVLLRVQPDHALFRHPSETSIAAVGYSLTDHSDERRNIENLQRFASAARKAGMATYVRGLRSLSLVTAAIGAGFDFVDGDIISSPTAAPTNAYEFRLDDLFARRFHPADGGQTPR